MLNNQDINEIDQLLKDNDNIVAMYNYGSQVYGTINPKSDHDFIIVSKQLLKDNEISYYNKFGDINNYSVEDFTRLIKEHEITALECIFLPKEHIWKEEIKWEFNLYLPDLRKSCSAKASNSWVKAKKKFIVEEDYNPYIGQKSAWHSLRIFDFGTQIATIGKIENYSRMNDLLPQILNCDTWEEIDEKFRKIHNNKASEFKLVAPKEIMDKTNKPKMK